MTRPAEVIDALARRTETLATAESLTGGLLGSTLVGVPGASRVYVGGVIVYATRLKALLAGVRPETLTAHGPVAGETAAELATGAARRGEADWGIATTGVAGPDPQDGHPVGQVFVAVARPSSGLVEVRELALVGDRAAIRSGTVDAALDLLAQCLGMPQPGPDVDSSTT